VTNGSFIVFLYCKVEHKFKTSHMVTVPSSSRNFFLKNASKLYTPHNNVIIVMKTNVIETLSILVKSYQLFICDTTFCKREKKLQYRVKQQRKLLQSIRNIKCCFRYKIILKQNNILQYSQNVKFHVVLLL